MKQWLRLMPIIGLGVLTLVLSSGCFRNPRLMDGIYITHDARVLAATPQVVNKDWEQRLSQRVQAAFDLDGAVQVSISPEPRLVKAPGTWQWQQMRVQVHTGPVLLDAGDLQQVISTAVEPVLMPAAQLVVEGGE